MKVNEWSNVFPFEPGSYWFYGCPYESEDFSGKPNAPELNYVEVRKVANGVMVVRSGHFWSKSEWTGKGLFVKIDLPELPLLK